MMIKLTKTYISSLLLILMFAATVYSLFNAGSWKLMLGFGIASVFCIIKSGQGLMFWVKWLSISSLSGRINTHTDIIKELENTPLNEQENKRNAILSILYFHKVLFHVVYALLFILIIGSFYFLFFESKEILNGLSGLSKITILSFFVVFMSFGIWWCRKTYPSTLRNDISYYHRILSRKNWEENPIFKGLEQVNEKRTEIPKTFEDYWISNEVSLDFIIASINKGQIYFECNSGKWLLIQGKRGNSYKRNLAGFVKALIELKYLKTSLCVLEDDAEHLKEVFLIKENKSGTELQQFHGANFQNLNIEYVEFFKEKLREISTESTPESLNSL